MLLRHLQRFGSKGEQKEDVKSNKQQRQGHTKEAGRIRVRMLTGSGTMTKNVGRPTTKKIDKRTTTDRKQQAKEEERRGNMQQKGGIRSTEEGSKEEQHDLSTHCSTIIYNHSQQVRRISHVLRLTKVRREEE